MGIDHTKLTYRFQGRDFRLTDVHGEVVKKILASSVASAARRFALAWTRQRAWLVLSRSARRERALRSYPSLPRRLAAGASGDGDQALAARLWQ